MTPIATKGLNKNLETFLMLITKTEGTDRDKKPYNTVFSYRYFSGFSQHPNIRVPFLNPKTNKMDYSTAAGRYQINLPTYDWLKMKSFTPEAQDTAAIELIKRNGAYGDIIRGDFKTAINKTNGVWASLPNSKHKQPTYTMQKAMDFIKQYAVPVATVATVATVSIGTIFFLGFLIYFINQK